MISKSCSLRMLACTVLLYGVLGIQSANGADIAYKIRQGADTSASFELGFQSVLADIPIVGWVNSNPETPTGTALELSLMFEGRAEWNGLFAETNSNSFSAFALGYSPWRGETANVDLVLSQGLGSYDPGIGAFQSVDNRTSDAVLGIRSTHNFDNTLVQFELYSDISGKHDGQMTAAQVGKFLQVRNWNFHALAEVRHFTGSMLNYYFGITEEESTPDIPVYKASGGTMGTLEIGATLPLAGSWVFRATGSMVYLPDSVTDSPLSDGRVGGIVSSTISYVF